MKTYSIFFAITIVMTSVGCTGPTQPFGVLKEKQRNIDLIVSQSQTSAKITTIPERMNFNDKVTFKIKISDPDTVLPSHQVKIFYNGVNITSEFKKVSQLHISNDKQNLIYTVNNLRLSPSKDNNIHISYQRDSFSSPVIIKLKEPDCPYNSFQPINNLSGFNVKNYLIDHINEQSKIFNVNPALIAALIAQESSYDKNAVSSAKAIGLTQVTGLAQDNIINNELDWPKYPNIDQLSVMTIKTKIFLEQINQENEWRLNPKLSVIGGIQYLKYLENYWGSEDARQTIQAYLAGDFKQLTDVILASYNSGGYRVKKELIQNGLNWTNSSNLTEAKKYIRKIKSYCHQFAHNGVSL